MPVTFSSYRLGPGQRVSNETVPPPWDWLLRRENELGPRRSRSQIIFAVLVPPFYVAVQAPALIVTYDVRRDVNLNVSDTFSPFFDKTILFFDTDTEFQIETIPIPILQKNGPIPIPEIGWYRTPCLGETVEL